MIRERAKEIVDFPAPVLPTIPILEPGVTVKDNPFSTMSVFGLYFRCTSLNLIKPFSGQSVLSGLVLSTYSWGTSSSKYNRYTDTILRLISPKFYKHLCEFDCRVSRYCIIRLSRTGLISVLNKIDAAQPKAKIIDESRSSLNEYHPKTPFIIWLATVVRLTR